jgi:hypothetical protein
MPVVKFLACLELDAILKSYSWILFVLKPRLILAIF